MQGITHLTLTINLRQERRDVALSRKVTKLRLKMTSLLQQDQKIYDTVGLQGATHISLENYLICCILDDYSH